MPSEPSSPISQQPTTEVGIYRSGTAMIGRIAATLRLPFPAGGQQTSDDLSFWKSSSSKVTNFCLRGTDHSFLDVGNELLRVVIAVGFENPRVAVVKINDCWLSLRSKNDRLHRHRGKIRHNHMQLLQHSLSFGGFGNNEASHAGKQREG